MKKHKIEHPYIVPDGFFETFKNETISKLGNKLNERSVKLKPIFVQSAKYAAIVAISFFLGRGSKLFINLDKDTPQGELYTIDVVFSQVSDEDITDFIIENVTAEMLEQKTM